MMPLSGSLPEVLHHLERIVGLLTSHLATPWGPAHDTALLLLSVLAKVRRPTCMPPTGSKPSPSCSQA